MNRAYHLVALCFLAVLAGCGDVSEQSPESQSNMRLAQLSASAEQGYADAQFNLGRMYSDGQGVPEDDVEAVKWYRLAAEQGYANAQCNLGRMYSDGQGVPEDDVEAVKWYRLAAEQGYANAQFFLGTHLALGLGGPQDSIEAYGWFCLAAVNGASTAAVSRNKLVSRFTPEQLSLAQQRATEMAVNQGNIKAFFCMGLELLAGENVPKDEVEAYVWFTVAAAGGHADAVNKREDVASKLTPEQLSQAQKRATELLEKIQSSKN